MNLKEPTAMTRWKYDMLAQEYLRSLPLEHFMEAFSQGTQRKITLESFDLIHAARPEVQIFNELLVQYPKSQSNVGQVVPDNMVVIHPEPIKVDGSYNIIFQPVRPFLVLEYVSKSSERKDYDVNMVKYERDLKVPYYLLFYPDIHELVIYHLKRRKYSAVPPNEDDRSAIPELELEAGLVDGWVRFWFRGNLLPLPGEMQRDLTAAKMQLQAVEDQLQAKEAENARLLAELEQLRRQKRNGR